MRIFLILALFLTSCSNRPDPAVDEQAILALIEQMETANRTGDTETWLGSFDDPFWYMPAYQGAVTSRDSLRAMTEQAFSSWDVDVSIEAQELRVSQDWAHAYSEVRGTAMSKDRTDSATVNLKQLAVYRRTEAGWKISKLMLSPNLWDM